MVGRGGKPGERGSVSQAGGDERGDGHAHVRVEARLGTTGPDPESDERTDRGEEESGPIAAKQFAEAAARDAGSDRQDIRRIVTGLPRDFLQFLLVFIQGIILLDRPPGEFADLREGSHIDAVFLAFLEFGERVALIAHVYHDHGVTDIQMQLLLGDSHESGYPLHVPFDAVCVRGAFYQQFSGTE